MAEMIEYSKDRFESCNSKDRFKSCNGSILSPTPYCRYKKYLASHDALPLHLHRQSIVMTYSEWKEQEELKFRAVEAKWSDKEWVKTWLRSCPISDKLNEILRKLEAMQ